jgi:hypothetical protein
MGFCKSVCNPICFLCHSSLSFLSTFQRYKEIYLPDAGIEEKSCHLLFISPPPINSKDLFLQVFLATKLSLCCCSSSFLSTFEREEIQCAISEIGLSHLLFFSLLFTTMLTRGGTSFGTTILLPSLFTSLRTKSRMPSRIRCCKSA